MIRTLRLLPLAALLAAGCAHSPPYDPRDPLEPVNRKIYAFNQVADRYVLRPVAETYVEVTPAPVRGSLGHFFHNLGNPVTIINGLLQGKFRQAGRDLGRFIINSTAGLGGFIDVATPVGLTRNNEDLGQTLGHYGVGPGWYLMLPFIGPSTNRDLLGFAGDSFNVDLRSHMTPALGYSLAGANVIHLRAGLLGADGFLDDQLDPYVALRTIYLERRLNLVYDGQPPLDYGEEPWDDDIDDWDATWDDVAE